MTYPVTPNPAIHDNKAGGAALTPIPASTMERWAKQLFEAIAGQVVSALTGGLIPANSVIAGTDAFLKLASFADNIPVLGTLVQALTGSSGGLPELTTFFTNLLGGLDLTATNPIVAKIEALIGSIPGVGPLIDTFVNSITGGSTTGNSLTTLGTTLQGLLGGIGGLSGSGSILTQIDSLISAIPGVGPLIDQLMNGLGVTGSGFSLTDLGGTITNLSKLLGNPSGLGTGGSFDILGAAEGMLTSVLTPAGALSSFTQIPQHLLGNLNFGQNITLPGFPSTVYNLLPDPGFADAALLQGGGAWVWDAKDHTGTTGSGSVKTTGASIVRQFIGVPITTTPGQTTDLGVWSYWSGVTASSGKGIALVASAYDATDALIIDSNRVVSAVAAPPTASTSYSGTDAVTGKSLVADTNGWVHLVGNYLAPAGTVNVRLTLEVESTVSAGSIWFDDCVQSIEGPLDSSLLGNIGNIPNLFPTSVNGFAGLTDLVNTFQHILDGLGSAYSPSGSVSGIDYTDLFSLAQDSNSNSLLAKAQGIVNTIALGQRTNKALSAGPNPTSEAMFSVGHFSSGGSVTTSSLAAGYGFSQMVRPSELATKGFVEFLASGTSVTNIFVNLFSVNPTTGAKTALWNSANLATLIPSSLGYVRALIPGGSQPTVNPGDNLMVEIVNGGSAALLVAAKATGIPNHPTEFPKNFGATRVTGSTGGSSPTSLTDSNITYSGTVPYVSLGISTVPATYHAPEIDSQTVAGSYSGTLPSWLYAGDKVTPIGIGGGGGGGSSLFYGTGQGGGSASWGVSTLVIGTDILIGSAYSFVVGGRGNHVTGQGGSGPGNNGNAYPGGDTTFTYLDPSSTSQTITFTGGTWGACGGSSNGANSNGINGQAAGNANYEGATYPGGTSVGSGSNGQSPGGGAGGAPPYGEGGNGGVGQLTLVFEQH